MEEKYLGKDGKVYYRVGNLRKGRITLFFVHGVSGSSSAWERYEREFEVKYNVISIDLRGHGKSFRPQNFDEYNIKYFAEDIREIIAKTGVKKVIVVAHSFGNFPVFEFLKKNQKLVNGAIFVSADSNPQNCKLARVFRYALKALPSLNRVIKNNGRRTHVNYERYIGTGDWNIRRTYTDVRNTGLRSYLYTLSQTYLWNPENVFSKIKIPTMIVHGRKDSIFQIKRAEDLYKIIPGSEFIVMEKANHIIVLNFFEELSRLIDDFVKAIS